MTSLNLLISIQLGAAGAITSDNICISIHLCQCLLIKFLCSICWLETWLSLRDPYGIAEQSKTSASRSFIHHFSWHFTCRQLCFFFHRQNIQTPSFSHQQPRYIISTLTLSSCHSPWFLSFDSCFGIQNPQDPVQLSKQAIWFRSYTNSDSIPGLSKNVHPYSSDQSPTLSTSYFRPVSSHTQGNMSSCHSLRNPLSIKMNSPTTGQSRVFLSHPK